MMSVYEKQFENDAQNSIQCSQSSKNSSKCILFNSERLDFNKTQKKSKERNETSFSSRFSTTSSPSTSFQAEEKFLPKITGWRRAALEDEKAIMKLQILTGEATNNLYRKKKISELIEKSYFSIVQFDKKGNLVSFSAYDSYPNTAAIPFSWDNWLTRNYRIDGITANNALFIHYMVWQPKYEKTFLPLLLETVFIEFVLLKYIIVIKPPKVDIPDFYSKYFIPILPPDLENLEYSSVQLLLLCLRSSIIQPLSIRTAFEQEFDVIMSAINDIIKKTGKDTPYVLDFVNFVLQEDRKTLICEFEGQIAGIMILNLKIDLDILNEGFELAPFNGLRKKEDKNEQGEHVKCETFTMPKESYNELEKGPNAMLSSEFLFSQMNWEMILSKIRSSDSVIMEQNSKSSLSSNSEFSMVSFYRLSSTKDLNKSDISQVLHDKRSEHLTKIGDINVVIRSSGNGISHFISPKYSGHSNAFIIDFFAIDCNKVDEKLFSFDFLEAAFKIVPDREYCVLLIPTDLLPIPLLDLFVRVTPRPMSTIKQELYLCHKNSLSVMSMSVRSIENDDLATINKFLKNVKKGDIVYQDILNSCTGENNNLKSFLLTAEETIVGVSLINSQDYIEHLRMYFEVAEFMLPDVYENENCSIIKHLVVSPLYRNHARFFVRDIMRLIGVSYLYYVHNKPHKNQYSLLTVLEEFAPIKPRRKIRLNKPISQVRLPLSEEEKPEDCFSLYFLNPRLCGFHKIHLNIVIVVVGVSQTSTSFLENLIFGPDHCFINYNNLICVTPQNPDAKESNKNLLDLMFPIKDNSPKNYESMLSLEKYVSFIYGIMTEINRTEKYIIINNKAEVRYDYLILTCGLQYLTPIPKAKEVKKTCRSDFRGTLARFLLRSPEQRKIFIQKHPNNMFIINTSNDAHNALRTLQFLMKRLKNVNHEEKKIIVYGHDLHVFLTIHTLLKLGIPGEFIVFVEPFPSETKSVTLFNDYSIDQAVLESVKECKVNYYTNYFLYDWSLSPEDYITAIKFHSKRKQLVIPCLAFFPFLEKLVSDVTFNACNNAGLVCDGKLVINHNFRTNDSYIYAAGPFTKYSRRYYANEYNHEYYNSREVGQKLAEIIRGKVDPTKEDITKEESDLVPLLKAPILLYCQLPGDFNLFILKKPGRELDAETACNYYDYGEVLTTGDCQMKNGFGYFRLHLNPEGFVESIICYTKDKIDYINLSSLYGLHERILNNLLLRYDRAMIPDFFEYFRQPWALALFHKNFQLLRDRNYKAFFRKTSDNKSFADKVVENLKMRNWQSLSNSEKHHLESKYIDSKIHQDIKNNLIEFLEYYREDLPMYATPSTVNAYLKKDQNRNKPSWC